LNKEIIHKTENKKIKMSFYTPNKVCTMRANTFSTKEPETLLWIEEFGKDGGILFDIGANIGLYSIFHSLLNNSKTYAFEPSFFNLRQLIRNINLNKCENLIVTVANPLTSCNKIEKFNYSTIEEGGALSGFGVDYGGDGEEMESVVSNNVIGFSLDYLIASGLIKDEPTMIKIDVDGIEHLILEGAMDTISSIDCRSILVEVNSDFKEQERKVHEILQDCGFVLREKFMSDYIHKHHKGVPNEIENKNTGNEIWIKE